MRPANERRRYDVTSSLNGWAHTQNDPWTQSTINTYVYGMRYTVPALQIYMMTSSNGNIFRVTGHLCGEFPAQRPVTRSFDVCFDLRLSKRLSKQSLGWWFETLPRPLWRHSNGHILTPICLFWAYSSLNPFFHDRYKKSRWYCVVKYAFIPWNI